MSQSSYQTNDGLSSEPAQLVVRHPPAEPRIYTDGRTFASEKQLSVRADREQVLTCESRGGNPAPLLTWWLGDIKLEASQRNESAASPDIKQWTAVSSLVHTFSKLDNRKTVKCSVYHAQCYKSLKSFENERKGYPSMSSVQVMKSKQQLSATRWLTTKSKCTTMQ